MGTNDCQWGKDRPPTGQFDGFSPASAQAPGSGYPPSTPQAFFPQYGQPGAMSPQGMISTFIRTKLVANPPLCSSNSSYWTISTAGCQQLAATAKHASLGHAPASWRVAERANAAQCRWLQPSISWWLHASSCAAARSVCSWLWRLSRLIFEPL
jgi:hypothetical protein